MAIQIEQLSSTRLWVHDGVTNIAEFDSSAGVKVSALTIGAGNGTTLTATSKELNTLDGIATTASVSLAAATAANGMEVTITALDAAGVAVAAVHQLEVWMSEAETGIGLTADTYSGDLVASTGAILSAHTSKKHWSVVTAETGIFVATLTDEAKPADQYVALKKPVGAGLIVSTASATHWGA